MSTQRNGPTDDNLEKNTQHYDRNGLWDRMKSIHGDRLAWLWLLASA